MYPDENETPSRTRPAMDALRTDLRVIGTFFLPHQPNRVSIAPVGKSSTPPPSRRAACPRQSVAHEQAEIDAARPNEQPFADVRVAAKTDATYAASLKEMRERPLQAPTRGRFRYTASSAERFLLLREWRRVLRVGGVLRLAVPDFAALAEVYRHRSNRALIQGPLWQDRDYSTGRAVRALPSNGL